MKKHACFAGLLLFFSPVSAQLTYENNRIVAGDEVTKQFISYKDSGRSGESCLWDFSEFSVQDGSYEVYYTGSSDTLLIAREHNTSYYYRLRGDSLLLQGLENRETLIRHKIPNCYFVTRWLTGIHWEDISMRQDCIVTSCDSRKEDMFILELTLRDCWCFLRKIPFEMYCGHIR